ncbi:putative disease resistance protein [Cinnamomum micranthum f. kanehirae]|uniref:Putative disease resistance protein n=1 Tax=Cinnamomum micranthum f. kanehirae TaxID=337451 RepID=A0A443P0F5_9MAGN|nr:putative disease resistance protein [Cinnamomum micranthum f. kanehirae]
MAIEAVVSFVVDKLNDHLIQEARLLYGVRHQLKWIESELKRMRYFLKDADSRQREDERVKNWVAQIREVCYDVEDVTEAYILRQNARRRRGFLARLKRYFCFASELRTRRRVGKKIERIKLKIKDISKRRETYGIRDINEGSREASSSSPSSQERRQSVTLLQESEVVGLGKETKILKERLFNGVSRRCVISIVGMGGSGKTTLAKKVYHDVKDDFDCHAFVHLSQQYEIKDVLMRIINCIMNLGREKIEKLDETELGMILGAHLTEKSYLVVVDDIWSIEAWVTLKRILPEGFNESRVILTTRLKDVALHADPGSYCHEMQLLNNNDGWELFLKKAFPERNTSIYCPSELEELGRNIFAKCEGLPLAILVLGGLLSRKDRTPNAWSKVLESVTSDRPESFEQCRKILALSYWDLPYYLKPCFLYLGLFPEDSEIGSGRLIRLWIAEGFIEQRGDQIMEDVAEDYLEELVHRSMIQVINRKSNGSIRKCRIHNILRDFSISEARQNNLFAIHNDNDTSSSLTSVRRLALYHSIDGYETTNHMTATLRSILCFPGSKVPMSKLLKMGGKSLRVLVVDGAEFTKEQLPKEVGAFVHLRYLELASTIDGSLPSSIGNLSNLQTLKLSFDSTLPIEIWNLVQSFDGTLPHAIWDLVQLRHLSAHYFNIDGHPKLHNLRNLQTLCLRAGSWIEDGLSKLTNLRKLVINGNLSSYHKSLSHSIYELRSLRSLKLYDGYSIPSFKSFTHHSHLYEMYLDGRTEILPMLPLSVAELTLKSSLLGPDAISTLEKLPRLRILKLLHESYDSKRMICSSSGFPHLELLKLCKLPLECLTVEEGAMMSLKSLELLQVSKLKIETLPERVRALLKQN